MKAKTQRKSKTTRSDWARYTIMMPKDIYQYIHDRADSESVDVLLTMSDLMNTERFRRFLERKRNFRNALVETVREAMADQGRAR